MESLQRGARWIAIPIVVIGVAIGVWYVASRGKASTTQATPAQGSHGEGSVTVEVTHPLAGGIARTCEQPGTVEAYESTDLYAKVSGYLIHQSIDVDGTMVPVDIGTRVKAGQVLAEIAVPELQKELLRDEAKVRDAEAKVRQMKAHKRAAEAEWAAAEASVKLAERLVIAKKWYREYRQKQLTRISALATEKAVDAKLVDEQEDYFLSAQEAENAAQEQVNTSKAKATAAKEKIAQAEADIDEAKEDVGVAEAIRDHSKVILGYRYIISPYDGVVTKRTFSPGKNGLYGAFIKAADQGGNTPLLTVERVDIMRVVVQVPDRDAPYVNDKSKATVQIDALPGRKFENLSVKRDANSEDKTTRTMRTEIDVDNSNHLLKSGYYGRVTIHLTSGTPGAIRIPSVALVNKAENHHGTVHVVRNGKVEEVKVEYETDNGIDAEIVKGLTLEDQVIVRSSVPVEPGMAVTVVGAGH